MRRLAAILAADVVGYSRLMGADEEGTHARLKVLRRDLLDPTIAEHHGRIVKTTGDGLLVEFASPVEAVRCAVALQQGLTDRDADLAEDQKIRFRIGINLGDVIVEDDDDIYGDGVNVAARLQALADPGGIFLSGTVCDQIRNKLLLGYTFLGKQRVKNIAEPVPVYRIGPSDTAARRTRRAWWSTRLLTAAAAIVLMAFMAAGASWYMQERRDPMRQAMAAKPSIAVLPFVNTSAEKEQEFFVDGLTEDLIIDLSNLSGLFVISRNSSFSYKNQIVKPQEIARDLQVSYVLTGSVRRSADRVRINAQLTDALNDRQIWAGRYDRELTDIFAVQDEVKKKIIMALQVKLTPSEQAQTMAPTRNIEAYDYYLRGRYAMNLLTRRALRLAYYAFERAIALDPNFAEAHAELAMTYALDYTGTNNAWNDWVRSPGRAKLQAEILARKATSLNHSLAAPDLVLARLALAEWRYDAALDHARNAVEREPGNAEAHATLALALTAAGDHYEAKRAIEEALRRDPKAVPSTHATLGMIQLALRDYEAASNSLERSFKAMVDGGNWFFGAFLIAADAYSGNNDALRDARADIFWGISLAAVRFNHFYRDAGDMEHLLEGLRTAGVPEFPPESDREQEAAERVTGPSLADLLSDREFETLCWNPRLNGELRFSADDRVTWTMRHDLTDTGTSRIGERDVCVKLPVITRNREACYSVFEVEGDNQLVRDYDHAFVGPTLCYFRARQ